MAEFGLGEKFEDGGGHQVRGGMPVDLERFRIFLGQDAQVGVVFERAGEVDQIAVRFGGERGVSQAGTDGLGNIEGRGPLWDFLGAAIGKLYVNAVRHD